MGWNKLWYAVTFRISEDQREALSHVLFLLGTLGTVEDPLRGATNSAIPSGEFLLKAYFPGSIPKEVLTHQLQEALAQAKIQPDFEITTLGDNDWGNNWKQFFKPFYLTEGLLITPSWEGSATQGSAAPCKENDLVVTIDPGMAFGTGQHATTKLCAELLLKFLKQNPNCSVLDLGTGSGILAIIAHKAGASKVTAVDIDPEALDAARENFEKNGCADKITLLDNIERDEVPRVADPRDADPRDAVPFDLIVANILSSTLVQLKPELERLLAPQGTLIVSGILKEETDEFCRNFQDFRVCDPSQRGGVREKHFLEDWAAFLI